jgi:hypothetical protein
MAQEKPIVQTPLPPKEKKRERERENDLVVEELVLGPGPLFRRAASVMAQLNPFIS